MKIEDLTGKLILRQHLGEGKYGDKEVTASVTNNSLILNFDKKQYGISWIELIKYCIEKIEKEKLEKYKENSK